MLFSSFFILYTHRQELFTIWCVVIDDLAGNLWDFDQCNQDNSHNVCKSRIKRNNQTNIQLKFSENVTLFIGSEALCKYIQACMLHYTALDSIAVSLFVDRETAMLSTLHYKSAVQRQNIYLQQHMSERTHALWSYLETWNPLETLGPLKGWAWWWRRGGRGSWQSPTPWGGTNTITLCLYPIENKFTNLLNTIFCDFLP